MNFKEDSFKKFLIYSLVGHVGLFLVYNLKLILLPSQSVNLQNAIHVDMVALPDKNPAPKKAQPPTKTKKETPKKTAPEQSEASKKPKNPTKKSAKKTSSKKAMTKKNSFKKDQQSALDKIKSLEKIEAFKEEIKQEESRSQVKGNKLAQGNSLTGLEKIQYNKYYDDIKIHLLSYWKIPQWLANQDFKAQALVKINNQGYVIMKNISKNSGSDVFDEHVIDTIAQASPFPPPPERIATYLEEIGIYFNFPEE